MAKVDIKISDYIHEVETEELIDELKQRIEIPKDTLKIVKDILGLREYKPNASIIEEITELIEVA